MGKRNVPKSKIHILRGNPTAPKNFVDNILLSHVFNFALEWSLLVHNDDPLSWCRQHLTLPQAYYYKVETTLGQLFTTSFISQHVHSGKLLALTQDTRIDCHNTVALLPSGCLVLVLTKDTYESCGMVGQPSAFGDKGQRFVVRLDLTSDEMQPGRAQYERMQWSFRNCLADRFSMLVAASDPDTGESLPVEFPSECAVKSELIQLEWTSYQNIPVPAVSNIIPNQSSRRPENEWEDASLELYEWLGMVGVDTHQVTPTVTYDTFPSQYSTPKPNHPGSHATLTVRGFLTPHYIHRLFSQLRQLADAYADTMSSYHHSPWGALSVWGFRDSPTSFGNKEHGYLTSGENDYTLIYWPSNHCLGFLVCGGYDEYA
ncbi:hypothetical protein IWQ61_007540 [Dispira simplex]|nr:hypothetical protein IWQ61_007540 [Dispira simplex]